MFALTQRSFALPTAYFNDSPRNAIGFLPSNLVAFSPNAQRAATMSEVGLVLIWTCQQAIVAPILGRQGSWFASATMGGLC